jgi:hypothetical protein
MAVRISIDLTGPAGTVGVAVLFDDEAAEELPPRIVADLIDLLRRNHPDYIKAVN